MSLIRNEELYAYKRIEDGNIVIYASSLTPGAGNIVLTVSQALRLSRALRKLQYKH